MKHKDVTLLGAESSKSPHRASARSRVEHLISQRVRVALFLDIDGTLIDMALTPSTVHVPPDLSALLGSISSNLGGALAIVTGRQIREADRLLHPLKLVAAGVHGAEMRLTRDGDIASLTYSFAPALSADLTALAQSLPGVVLEDKGAGIAFHYRLAPEHQGSLLLALTALASKYPGDFAICEGRKVVEVLTVGFSKGLALRKLAALPGFANRVPIMIGDDIADVDAFNAAEELGGFGLKVEGENFSAAEASFLGPREVLDWLRRLRTGFKAA